MSTLLFLVTLFCVLSVSTSIWGPSKSNQLKRDCQWMHWSKVGRCEKTGRNTFRIKRRRVKVPARNGGKECVGFAIDYYPCRETQYLAATFLKTVNSISKTTTYQSRTRYESGTRYQSGTSFSSGTSFRGFIPPPRTPPVVWRGSPDSHATLCSPPYRDATNNLRMFGNPCVARKRKRRAGGSIESIKVPLRESMGTRTKRSSPIKRHRDILFLLDESGSVGSDNFKKELRMTRAIVNTWCDGVSIAKDQTRVGILSFDKHQHVHLEFDQLFRKSSVLKHMEYNVKYSGHSDGRTCLNDALEYTQTSMFLESKGARMNDDGAEQLVVLFTDGCANCEIKRNIPGMLSNLARKFERQKIPMIVYFIGKIQECVTIMESLSDGSRCYHVFRALDWNEFDEMIEAIENEDPSQCTDAWHVIGDDCPHT